MRARWMLVAAVLAACSDSTSPPPPDDGELPRGDWQILVESISRAGQRSYYLMSPDGAWVAPLAGFPHDAARLQPSPDGRTIAWLRETDDLLHLWTMDRLGASRRAIVDGDVVVHDMEWSPDGTRLAVDLSTLDDANDIWIYDAISGEGTQITFDLPNAALFDQEPSWSPDGSRIVMTSNRSGGQQLWIMNADGSGLTELTTPGEGLKRMAAWSPDGSLIAFHAQSSAGVGIGLVRPNGLDHRIIPFTRPVASLSWTPEGEVLFTGVVDLDYEVLVLNPATGAIRRVTTHPSHDFRAWPFRHVTPAAWRGLAAGARYGIDRPNSPALVAADVNADGNPDLALLGPAASEIRILLGIGDGTFQPLGGLTAPADQRAGGVADVSRDDIDDVIVLGAGALHVWRGSAGGPGVGTAHPFDGAGRGLAVSDFDMDGSPDVAVVHERPAGFGLYVFASRTFDGELVAVLDHQTAFHAAGRACAGDITGDGRDDVIVLTGTASSPVVLLPGRGDITFGEATVATTAVPADAEAIPVCADFTGDRRADLALLTGGAEGRLRILRSTGSTFAAPVTVPLSGTAMEATDVDRDGDIDLMVVPSSGSSVQFLRNRGDGTFAAPTSIPVTGLPWRLVAADLNRDGWPDLGVADIDGSIGVLRNRGR